jgi:hypothetical protein
MMSLIPHIRALGMETIIPLYTPRSDNKGVRAATAKELVAEYATVVSIIEGRAGGPGSYIRGVDTENAVLVRRLFSRRTDLGAEYSSQVDTWLKHMFGEHYHAVTQWIGHALAFEDGPICALSVSAAPGCGKKLFYQGLAECITTEIVADGKEMGQFASLLLRTPFMVINEGMPDMGRGAKHPADQFRHLVGGDPIPLEQKFMDTIIVRSPTRVIFMANNTEVVRILTAGRDLSNADRDALVQRLFHIDASETKAVNWLRTNGGLAFTGKEGHRWIMGDAGQPSDYIVARHFLWLHANREAPKPGARLLVEGSYDPDIMSLLTTRSGSAPLVVETVVAMVEAHAAPHGLAMDKKIGLCVTSDGVVQYFRKYLAKDSRETLTNKQVTDVLRGLVNFEQHRKYARELETPHGTLRARWWALNAEELLDTAQEYGLKHTRLAKFVTGAQVRQMKRAMVIK